MTNSIYLTTTESHCGKSLISLGIMEMLLRKTKRVGVFRPLISEHTPGRRDKNIDLILSHFDLKINYADTYAFLMREANELLAQGKNDEFLDRIIEKYKVLENQCDFILCIGSDFVGESSAFEFDINTVIAQNLGVPVLVLGNGANRDIAEAVDPVRLAVDLFRERGCQMVGAIINRADKDRIDELLAALHNEFPEGNMLLSVIPGNRILNSPNIKEIVENLNAEVLYGADRLARQVFDYKIIAMQVQNFLPHLNDNSLVITPGDRPEIILSTLQAHQSRNYPQVAGILLTTGLKPAPAVQKLLDGLPSILPILAVPTDTFTTATNVGKIRSYITPDNHAKINLSLKLFEKYVDIDALHAQISSVQARGLTPKMFLYNLVQKAKANKRHIVLPEATDERILRAAEILSEQDIVEITLLGNEDEVKQAMARHGRSLDFNKVHLVDPEKSPLFDDYWDTLYQLRKHKGLTREHARDLICDVSYFGTMMVYKGHADGMVSGAAHTTMHTIRPALQFVKTKPGFSVVSSVFFMCLEDRVLVYGDCAVNPKPTAQQLAEIALASADSSLAFGIEPKVAMLSYSSGDSGKGEEVDRVREATQIAKERRPDLKIEGPIQYDAAVDPEVGKKKLPNSEVAGQATVLIFPDLNTGNNTYKAVQRETGALAVGPMLQGLNKPVNDLSRGCTVEDIVNTVVITAIQSQIE
ncbi:MAG: phosphate acetyltransferase [Chloroflexi bacterium]|nr:MAG: phosphate acetyltransferase [Chloroflexota bacterium]